MCSIFLVSDKDDTDFESGLGMWSNTQDDNFDWTRNQGYTQTKDTGPMQDHTSGNGECYNNLTTVKTDTLGTKILCP